MKKLACRLGRHDWTTRVEGGESYKVCASCGKTPREQGPPVQQKQQRDQSLAGGGDPGIGGDGGGGNGGGGPPPSGTWRAFQILMVCSPRRQYAP